MNKLLGLMLGAVVLAGCATQADSPLETKVSNYAAIEQGKPGGIYTSTEELNATVAEIDQKTRTFVLKDDKGNRRTVQAPPEMVNFPQLQVGDQVTAVLLVETVVALTEAGTGAPTQAGALAAAPEQGQKPGMFAAARVTTTAKVLAVNDASKSATLQLEDGSTLKVRVRDDVKLLPAYVGKNVVIDITTAVAAEVKKR
ncbi:MAG: hypothetical protein QG667_141 [Pseudomonadota bacterium]|nr:hypothetical protein [Pseudomonadota bacterium]